jgi:hypothetical protein
MKLFSCQRCGTLLYFENTQCETCLSILGFVPENVSLEALVPAGGDSWTAVAPPGETFRFCANARYGVCNWLVAAERHEAYCRACRLNRTTPDLSIAGNLQLWRRLEAAKHRLVYGLLRLDLPLADLIEDPQGGLAFDFLAANAADHWRNVSTGHMNGVVTIDIAEADDAARERQRTEMQEPYRALLGHFRHEAGHHYWERLVRDGNRLESFRQVFGDERRDYTSALTAHYGAAKEITPPCYVSRYASAHPWEDFAETWAHYLHIVDTLETAAAFGITIAPRVTDAREYATAIDFDAYCPPGFDVLGAAWHPLTSAVNNLNQSMGQPDLYPFVLTPAVQGKLRFVHGLIHTPANAPGTTSMS